MFTVVIEKFENLRRLVHARLLSSEYHDLRNVVKEHVAADVWKTYCITDGNTASNITYSLLRHWHLTIEDLSVAAAENESGTQTVMKMSEVLQAYLETPPWDESPGILDTAGISRRHMAKSCQTSVHLSMLMLSATRIFSMY